MTLKLLGFLPIMALILMLAVPSCCPSSPLGDPRTGKTYLAKAMAREAGGSTQREGISGVVNELLIQLQSFDQPPASNRLAGWVLERINRLLRCTAGSRSLTITSAARPTTPTSTAPPAARCSPR